MKSLSVTIQMKCTEQYFPVLLFIVLYKLVLTFRRSRRTFILLSEANDNFANSTV